MCTVLGMPLRLENTVPTHIFSTYSTGENRVTGSVLAVLRSLSIDRCQTLLGALLERPEFELVRFQDQPSADGRGVPDAWIRASCSVLIETKIAPNTVSQEQLERHLERLGAHTEEHRSLLVLTPDASEPLAVERLGDARVSWASFASLDQAVDELLADPQEVISEREAFLLRELQAMLDREQLVASAKDVVVVAARAAWPEYRAHAAYICQPGRSFQRVSRIAFYTDGAIQPLVPMIESVHDEVIFDRGQRSGRLGDLIGELLDESPRSEGQAYKVFLLTSCDDDRTVTLGAPVRNDLVSKSGRTSAFTQGQRYVALEDLRAAQTTSDIVDA